MPSGLQANQRLDLADDLAAGTVWIEDLVEKAKEGAAEGIEALPAVRAFLSLGEQGFGLGALDPRTWLAGATVLAHEASWLFVLVVAIASAVSAMDITRNRNPR